MSNPEKIIPFNKYQIKKNKESIVKNSSGRNRDSHYLLEKLVYSNPGAFKASEDIFHDILKIENLMFNNESNLKMANHTQPLGIFEKNKSEREAQDMSNFDDKLQSQKDVFEAKMEAQESRISSQITSLESKLSTSTNEISAKIDNVFRELNTHTNDIRVELIKAQQDGIDKLRAERKEDHKYILGTAIGIAGVVIAALSIIIPIVLN